jgi:hypothetical protein
VDGEVFHPSLEMSRGEGEDLIQYFFTDVVVEHPVSPVLHMGIFELGDAGATGGHGAEETDVTDAAGDASLASGLAVSASAPASMTLSARSLVERQIMLPFVDRSTRYAVL